MLSIIEIYSDVVKDTANADQNGQISYAHFSRISKRAEILLLDWISGGVTNERLPIPYVSQKDKDWLSPFITKYPKQVVDGFIDKPADYYQWENFYRLGSKTNADCEDSDLPVDDCNTPIEILDGQQFYERCHTYIDELKVSLGKPISKLIGKQIETLPKDMGSVCLEYIRMPKFGFITPDPVPDPIFNDEVPSVIQDYEWDEWARVYLIWFICDIFSNSTREEALKKLNAASNPKQ